MLTGSVDEARKQLQAREGCTLEHIAYWQPGSPVPESIVDLPQWAAARSVEALVWTALGPKYADTKIRPTADQVVAYLKGLRGDARREAKRYVEFAPPQIDTVYRRLIEAELGWVAAAVGAPHASKRGKPAARRTKRARHK